MEYVTSGIYGDFDKFKQMLLEINFSDNDNLYLLGNIISNNISSIELISYIMSKTNIKILKSGRNEEFLQNCLCFYDARWENGKWNDIYKKETEFDKKIMRYILNSKYAETIIVNNQEYQLGKYHLTNSYYREIFDYIAISNLPKPTKHDGILHIEEMIFIDCWEDGKLACLRLDDMKEFYV